MRTGSLIFICSVEVTHAGSVWIFEGGGGGVESCCSLEIGELGEGWGLDISCG